VEQRLHLLTSKSAGAAPCKSESFGMPGYECGPIIAQDLHRAEFASDSLKVCSFGYALAFGPVTSAAFYNPESVSDFRAVGHPFWDCRRWRAHYDRR
jgi:hypothetical protein